GSVEVPPRDGGVHHLNKLCHECGHKIDHLYEELEEQALIYKYLVTDVLVPQDLLLTIRRGFESLASQKEELPPVDGVAGHDRDRKWSDPSPCTSRSYKHQAALLLEML
ncbi:hypothetical protein ZWY2020_030115, partial [Hordeum vulgare]